MNLKPVDPKIYNQRVEELAKHLEELKKLESYSAEYGHLLGGLTITSTKVTSSNNPQHWATNHDLAYVNKLINSTEKAISAASLKRLTDVQATASTG